MPVRLVIEVPDVDSAELLLANAVGLGGNEVPLAQLGAFEAHEARILASVELRWLRDLEALTAFEVWRRVTYPVYLGRKEVFPKLCAVMQLLRRSFCDTNPAELLLRTATDWQQRYDVSAALAKALADNGLIGEELVMKLEEDAFLGFRQVGPALADELHALKSAIVDRLQHDMSEPPHN